MSGLTAIVKDIKGDKVIWMIALILCIASIMAVYSATSSMVYQQVGGNSEKYLLQQLMFIGLGAVVTYLCYRFHYMLYAKLSFIIICVTVLALFYTKFFGIDINGATRWIGIPWIGKTIQTSDLAKIGLIIYLSH